MIAEFNITFQATFQYCIVFQSPNTTTKDIIIVHFHREKIHIHYRLCHWTQNLSPWVNRRDFGVYDFTTIRLEQEMAPQMSMEPFIIMLAGNY